MQIILLRDVAKVGRAHEVREVADGYARNVLIARGWAKVADAKALQEIKQLQQQAEAKQTKSQAVFNVLAAKLTVAPLTIKAKSDDKGHLFAAIHASDIAQAIKQATGLEVEEKNIDIATPIKSLGEHVVSVGKGRGVVVKISITSI